MEVTELWVENEGKDWRALLKTCLQKVKEKEKVTKHIVDTEGDDIRDVEQ